MPEQREPDWKTISQAAMQQRDEANRNLCNLQIELAVMAEKLRKYESGEQDGTSDQEVTAPRATKKPNSVATAETV